MQQCWRVRADSSEGVAQPDSQSSSKEKPKPAKAAEEMPQPVLQLTAIESHGLKPLHLVTFFIILGAGLVFLSVLLYFTADIQFQQACFKVRSSPPWPVRWACLRHLSPQAGAGYLQLHRRPWLGCMSLEPVSASILSGCAQVVRLVLPNRL